MSNRSDRDKYIVVDYSRPKTVGVGVYIDERLAQEAYVRVATKKYPILVGRVIDDVIGEGEHIDSDTVPIALITRMILMNNTLYDLFGSELSLCIVKLKPGERFDFAGYVDWDLTSLYKLLERLDTDL